MVQADSGADEGAEKSTFQFGTWYPIETAPKDEELLMYCPWRHMTNPERIECGAYGSERGGWNHAWATHWMPLPPPPPKVDREVSAKSDAEE